jgi:hypothetical protein
MIKGYATEGFLPNHLVDQRGLFINIPNCPTFSEAERLLIARGNENADMNYILSVKIEGSTGHFTAQGEPVRLVPEPPQTI